MKIISNPELFFKRNLCLIGLLLIANILGVISTHYFGHDHIFGLVGLFNFDSEYNIPTSYSSVALLFSSFLLSHIAFKCKILGMPYILWFVLSSIFLFLSIDEVLSIHERLAVPVRDTLGTSGLLYFAWVIPYGVALLAFVMLYTKFLFNLPRKTMVLFLISGTLFVSGAIGFELLGGLEADLNGNDTLFYSIITTCEELLEMLGIALFIYTLLTYLNTYLTESNR